MSQVEFGHDDDRVIRCMAGDHHGGIAVGLVHRLVGGRRETAQVKDIRSQIRDQSIECPPLEGVEEPVDVAQLRRQRAAFECR